MTGVNPPSVVVDRGGEVVNHRFHDLALSPARVAQAFLSSRSFFTVSLSLSLSLSIFVFVAAIGTWLDAFHLQPGEGKGDVVHQFLARAVQVPKGTNR